MHLMAALAVLIPVLVLLLGYSWGRRLPAKSLIEVDALPMTIEVLHPDPLIRVVRNFITQEEAIELVAQYEHLLGPSTVASDINSSETSISPQRVSSSAYLPVGSDAHPLIESIEMRAVLLAGKALKHMETLQLLRYKGRGQFYKRHFDYFHDNPKSQRTTTIFVYLNDTSGEGSTHFPRLNLKIQPEQGKACIWENCRPVDDSLECDARLEHAGLPLESDHLTKYGLNIWFRSGFYR